MSARDDAIEAARTSAIALASTTRTANYNDLVTAIVDAVWPGIAAQVRRDTLDEAIAKVESKLVRVTAVGDMTFNDGMNRAVRVLRGLRDEATG